MNTFKQHWHELLALPFLYVTVSHTHDGFGLGSPEQGWMAAFGVAAIVWLAWRVVSQRNTSKALWAAALTSAVLFAGVETTMMYQTKGDLVDTGYAVEKAKYDRELIKYNGALDAFNNLKKLQTTAIEKQMDEITSTGKLTSRKADMERLTQELDALASKAAPSFALVEPVATTHINKPWLITTIVSVFGAPLAYLVIAAFGMRRGKEAATVSPADAPVEAVMDAPVAPVELCHATVNAPVARGTVAPVGDTANSDVNAGVAAQFDAETMSTAANKRTDNAESLDTIAILAAVARITALPLGATFDCPVCAAAAVKSRADRTTCGTASCRSKLKRAKAVNHNVITFNKPAHNTLKGTSHGK